MDICKWLKGSGLLRLGVEYIVHAYDITKGSGISEAEADVDIVVGVCTMQIVNKTLYLPSKAGLEVKDFTAAKLALFEGAEVETSDDTKVVSPTFEGCP